MPRLPSATRTRRALLAAVLTTFLALGLATPARADNDLEDASPAAGSSSGSSPGRVELEFDRTIVAASISVTGPTGDAGQGGTRVLGHGASRDLRPNLPGGSYTVSYRTTRLLGEQNSGSYTFTLTTPPPPAAPAPSASATPTATPTPTETATATPTPTVKLVPAIPSPRATPSAAAVVTADPTARPTTLPETVPVSSSKPLPPVFWWVLLAALALAAWGLWRWRERGWSLGPARSRDADGPDDDAPTLLDSLADAPPSPRRQARRSGPGDLDDDLTIDEPLPDPTAVPLSTGSLAVVPPAVAALPAPAAADPSEGIGWLDDPEPTDEDVAAPPAVPVAADVTGRRRSRTPVDLDALAPPRAAPDTMRPAEPTVAESAIDQPGAEEPATPPVDAWWKREPAPAAPKSPRRGLPETTALPTFGDEAPTEAIPLVTEATPAEATPAEPAPVAAAPAPAATAGPDLTDPLSSPVWDATVGTTLEPDLSDPLSSPHWEPTAGTTLEPEPFDALTAPRWEPAGNDFFPTLEPTGPVPLVETPAGPDTRRSRRRAATVEARPLPFGTGQDEDEPVPAGTRWPEGAR